MYRLAAGLFSFAMSYSAVLFRFLGVVLVLVFCNANCDFARDPSCRFVCGCPTCAVMSLLCKCGVLCCLFASVSLFYRRGSGTQYYCRLSVMYSRVLWFLFCLRDLFRCPSAQVTILYFSLKLLTVTITSFACLLLICHVISLKLVRSSVAHILLLVLPVCRLS